MSQPGLSVECGGVYKLECLGEGVCEDKVQNTGEMRVPDIYKNK